MAKTTKKKKSPLQAMGKSVKDTFMEMSESLAGWIDDTGAQFQKTFQPKAPKKSAKSSQQSNCATEKPKPEC